MASTGGAMRAVGLIGAANLTGAALIALAGLIAGVLGMLFFDNPHASKLVFLGEVALLVVVPVAASLGCRTAGRRLVAGGRPAAGVLAALAPTPLLLYALGRAATAVFHPR